MKVEDKRALLEWNEFVDNIRNSTPVDITETHAQKAERIRNLEANPQAWFRYYFPKACFAPSPQFHVRSTTKLIAHLSDDDKLSPSSPRHFGFRQCRPWSRGLSKSTLRMMEMFYIAFAKKFPLNLLLISKSEGNAIRLLMPYRGNLEGNQRLIHDYGEQQGFSNWREEEFITREKKAFRAVGAEQNPRGSKIDEIRPNVVLFDDVDDDEVCRNPDRLEERWNWIERAVIFTVEISRKYFILFDNNIIAEDCCVRRAMKLADDAEIVNIRDENGVSVWPEKNTEAMIDEMINGVSWAASQQEFFNNPIRFGKVFQEITWGEVPPLSKFRFLVAYADPATSNKDKTAAGKKSTNSTKAVVLVGKSELKYYVITAFVDVTTNSTFTEWLYEIERRYHSKVQLYTYIENNTLQDPFYQQVFMPLFFEEGKKRGNMLSIIPDKRQKPEKFFRIEGTLEPLNRLGLLIFNNTEKDNPHMQRLEAQFKAVSPASKTMDGPDAVEGAVNKIKEKELLLEPDMAHFTKRSNAKRF